MQVIWYTAMSMDGRIADADDSLAFLDRIDADDEAAEDFARFVGSVDGVLVGARTLRWLHAQGHLVPHEGLPTWVLTHDAALAQSTPALRHVHGDIGDVLQAIERAGVSRLWLAGGGQVASQLLDAGLIDEVVLTIAPTVLGAGPSLFGDQPVVMRRFELAEHRRFGRDALRVRWVRLPEPPSS